MMTMLPRGFLIWILLLRRAAANTMALRDYERVSKVRPNDKDAKAKFTECRKIVQQIAFNKAIAVDEKATFAIFFFENVEN